LKFFYKLYIYIFALALTTTAGAVELGIISEKASNSTSLLINGRNISINTAGIGVQASERFLGNHLDMSLAALFAAKGESRATFSGTTVYGPANLATASGFIKAYAFPASRFTPFVAYAVSKKYGSIEFSGLRDITPVLGKAHITYDQNALGLGFLVYIVPGFSLEMIMGKHQWKLLSEANGTLGKVKVTTDIEAGRNDRYSTLALKYRLGDFVFSGEYGVYQLQADNKITTNDVKAAVSYCF
jgi:hypothetical protein